MSRTPTHVSACLRALFGPVVAAAVAFPTPAWAGQEDVLLLPTVTPMATAADRLPELTRPDPASEDSVARWARRLDGVLHEAVQDLGLTLDVSERLDVAPRSLTEDALVERARESWVVSPRMEFEGGRVRIRLLAVAPGSSVVLLRTQEVDPRDVTVRAMIMLRDVIQTGRGAVSEDRPKETPTPGARGTLAIPARSQGRAVLALNSAAFGGYIGFSLQRASGSDDNRLTYPLIALGTGIGLGASMIVADEWDVGLGDAWYLSAGTWWPAAGGLLLAESYGVEPADDRFVYGLIGAAGGVTLATASLSTGGMGEGGATLTHSGGAFGMFLGGMTQLAIEGTTEITPTRGMGYGTGAGVIVAGAVATQVSTSPARVLMVDLGAVLGGLTGAAAASPLVFGDEVGTGKSRAFAAAIGAGTIAGGVIAYVITEPPSKQSSTAPDRFALSPFGGVLGESVVAGVSSPIYGAGVGGKW